MEEQPKKSSFEGLFPFTKFDSGAQWSNPQENPEERIIDFAKQCLEGKPKAGAITFEELPNGGYEIKYFKSRE